jgi:hypothetical protein
MKIGIDVRLYAESGNGRYIRGLLKNLYELDINHSYILYCLRKDSSELMDLYGKKWKIVIADLKWYSFQEQLLLPLLLYKERLDLVHFPHFNVPVLYFKKFVVTIHDLTHYSFSMRRATTHNQLIYALKHAAYNFAFNSAVHKSHKIIAVSHYVKDAIVEKFNIDSQKITVTYEAADTDIYFKRESIAETFIKSIPEN